MQCFSLDSVVQIINVLVIYLPPVICFTYKMHYVDVKDKGEDERSDDDPVNDPRQVKVLQAKLYLNKKPNKYGTIQIGCL